MHERLLILVRWAPATAWAGVIFRLSAMQGSDLPGAPGWVGHLGVYTILGALVFTALDPSTPIRRRILLSVAVCSLYGVSDEFHQSFVPTRFPDPVDWLVDTAGAVIGSTGAHILRTRLFKPVSNS